MIRKDNFSFWAANGTVRWRLFHDQTHPIAQWKSPHFKPHLPNGSIRYAGPVYLKALLYSKLIWSGVKTIHPAAKIIFLPMARRIVRIQSVPIFYDGIMNHWPWWSMLWYDDIAPVKFGLNPRREKKSLTKNHRGIAPWASWVHCLKLETIRMVCKK